MKHKIFAALTIVSLVCAFVLPGSAFAAAYGTAFVTSITYQNLSQTSTANITFNFQAANSSTQTPVNVTLPAKASGSLFLGSVGALSSGFKGSAVMSSDQPIVATLVQVPSGTQVKNRPLSNGFAAGSPTVLIATALKNTFNTNSIITIQNSDSVADDLTVKFFAAGSSTPADTETVTNLPAGAAQYYDLGTTIGSLPNPFNGSVTVTAIKHGGAPGSGNVVATVMELSTNGTGADAFEGVSAGATTVFMPSALCNAFGGTNSSYAIQNTSASTTANVTVHYSSGQHPTFAIPAGSKHSFVACSDGVPAGTSGAATITSDQPIVGIGKVFGLGLSTAFVGPSSGANHIALPYVRWATDANFNNGSQQRTFIAIQNVGAPISAGTVTVQYFDKNGVQQGSTHTLGAIATGGKVNSNPTNAGLTEFGITGGQFGGGAIVTGPGGSQLVAIARVESKVTGGIVGEDYNGIVIP